VTIEFLPGDEPKSEDEALGAPDPHPRRWWGLAAVLTVAVAAWVVTRPSTTPSTSPSTTPSTSTASTSSRGVGRQNPAPRTDVECRHVPDCSVSTDVPAAVKALVRAYLPTGAVFRVRSVIAVGSLTLRNQLVARDIDATIDSVSVLIRVRRGGSRTQAIVPDPLGVGSLLLHGVNAGYVVRLQYLAPDTVPPVLGRLRAMIHDPRLTTLSA
jgi:hypothetical protein